MDNEMIIDEVCSLYDVTLMFRMVLFDLYVILNLIIRFFILGIKFKKIKGNIAFKNMYQVVRKKKLNNYLILYLCMEHIRDLLYLQFKSIMLFLLLM